MTHFLLENLNEPQQKAVSAPPEHMLILAGAGSGKTRVLVHRMAWLAQEANIPIHHMLAVTFTNKAAREIRHRLESLLHIESQHLWLGTFHSIAHRLLRMHTRELDLPDSFQIMDSEDQLRLLKRMLKDQNLDDQYYSADKIQIFINQNKEQGLRAKDLKFNERDIYRRTLQELYLNYEKICQKNGVIDFAELLLRTYELFRDNDALRHAYQMRFQAILVDEFQDTNTIQYAWLKQLIGSGNKLMVVGDDDQSIYGWRGAKIENIHKVQKDFPGLLIRLEQNYRSTQTILDAANAVIANNAGRLGKELWSKGMRGKPIQVYQAYNELDEARFVISKIEEKILNGIKADEIAILYRANAQSRVLEEALLQQSIPYRVYGGLRFFDRAEIKNALAYARLAINPSDDGAFERIINLPARGIGEKTLSSIRETAKDLNTSLWVALQTMLRKIQFTPKIQLALQNFENLFISFQEMRNESLPKDQLEKILNESGLIIHYQAEPDEKSQGRVENLQELLNAIDEFYAHHKKTGEPATLNDFIAHACLESSADQTLVGDAVQLMTLHAAKGLEFRYVFLVGMEEELFPGRACQEDPIRLEEERRLCYVGMTRAMEELTLSHTEYRRLYGETKIHSPSRFLMELPRVCVENVRMTQPFYDYLGYSKPKRFRFNTPDEPPQKSAASTISASPWKIGMNVSHSKFGEGIVLSIEGQNQHTRLQIKFREVGVKWMLAEFIQVLYTKNH